MTHQEPPPVGPAIEVEATERNLRRYLRIARLAAVVASLLLVSSVALWISHAGSLNLQTDGARAVGTVTDVSGHRISNPHVGATSLLVSFDASGVQRHERISLGRSTDQIREGQKVTVRYDSADPAHAEVQGYPIHGGLPPLIPLFIGVVVLAFSWPGIRRVRFLHRVLTADPWVEHPSRLVEVPMNGPVVGLSGRVRVLLRIEGMTGVIVAAPVGLRRLNPTFTPVAWVAGYGDGQMVVAPPGGSPIVCVRRIGK